MRVLLTRPEPDCSESAEKLRQLGHEAVCWPLTVIAPTHLPRPDGAFSALVVTSRNAARLLDARDFVDGPVFAVGEATQQALLDNGFKTVVAGQGTAAALARLLAARLPRGQRVLYACGDPRKPEFEQALAQEQRPVVAWLVYRAEATLPQGEPPADIDAVLHYSRASAERFAKVLESAPGLAGLGRAAQLCLSVDVAGAVLHLPAPVKLHAKLPNEASLFSLLAICRS